MQRKLFFASIAVVVGSSLLACASSGSSDDVRRIETPVNVTSDVAYGDYRRVYNTMYHVVNRYGMIQRQTYTYGEIEALVAEDTHLFDKTRTTILARIVSKDGYYDVECKVLQAVETGDHAVFEDRFHQEDEYHTVGRMPNLEVQLQNEIRRALTGGALESKQPLLPRHRHVVPHSEPRGPQGAPAQPSRAPQQPAAPSGSGGTDEVRVRPGRTLDRLAGPVLPSDFDRLSVAYLRHGAWGRAEDALKQDVLAQDFQDPYGHYLLAQTYYSQGNFAQAANALRNAVTINPDWIDSGLDLRDLYGAEDDTFARRLRELKVQAQQDSSLQFLLGYMSYGSQAHDQALLAFDKCLETKSNDAVARRYRDATIAALEEAQGYEEF